MTQASDLARAIVQARPRAISVLAVHLRDLDAAEDAFSEASEACLALDKPPDNVTAWLITTGKRKAIDAIRKHEAQARAAQGAAMVSDMADVIQLPEAIPDERLRLIFICCHPALAVEARVALALKVICGLPVSAIARVFVCSEATMFQRITRAKAKVKAARIDFELPPRKAWAERLDAVFLTLELAYTVAYQDAAGEIDAELSGEIVRLAQMTAQLLPKEPEALGLAALVTLAKSRETARIDEDGAMVPLSQQDVRLWDFDAIEQARQWLDKAALLAKPGPHQIMATIQLTHARRAYDAKVDWPAILALYNALMVLRPGPMVQLNRALAVAQVEGPECGLRELESLPEQALAGTRPFHVACADLLVKTGAKVEAMAALDAAIALDPPRAERLFLKRKRVALSG